MPSASRSVVADLLRLRTDAELSRVRKRLPAGEEAFGLRMRDLFDAAKAHRDIPLGEVEALLDHPAYEPRLAAFCILDFKAQRRLTDDERRELYDIYLRRHDRITTWDMVDRAAPRVVGGYLAGRSLAPLHELAAAAEPLRRRTAITAPLQFVKAGGPADLTGGFDIASRLAADPEPVVHNAVGIFLKHAGTRDPETLHRFLHTQAATMPRAALRLAIEKLSPAERNRYLQAGRS
jgi:3-methyladenine DNA glycosylase AlkD